MLSDTDTYIDYAGNGSTTSFAIGFGLQENTQVVVSSFDTGIETLLVVGVDYTVTGGDPGTAVLMTVAPAAGITLRVARETPKTQDYDYIETGTFKAEDHEAALDRIVMMIQELGTEIAGVVTSAASGAFARQTAQDMAAGDTVGITTDQRSLKNIQATPSGGPVAAHATMPIANGSIDGQELRLVGISDSDTVTMLASATNVIFNGDITFELGTVWDGFWDDTLATWIESGRNK